MDETSDAITLSEEQLEIHTRSRVVGRVRLRKRIVTETVQVSVEIRREELEIVEYEPGQAFYDDVALGEEAFTLVLSAEEPVVGVRAVPVERVHVHKVLLTEHQDVTAELRSEEAEFEELPPARG